MIEEDDGWCSFCSELVAAGAAVVIDELPSVETSEVLEFEFSRFSSRSVVNWLSGPSRIANGDTSERAELSSGVGLTIFTRFSASKCSTPLSGRFSVDSSGQGSVVSSAQTCGTGDGRAT